MKKNLWSRLLSVLVIGLLVITLIPVTAFAGQNSKKATDHLNGHNPQKQHVSKDKHFHLSGTIWTTDASGYEVNKKIFIDKDDVYLSGGPNKGGHLPIGEYYIQVTTPSGKTVLGKSTQTYTVNESGKFEAGLIQLSAATDFEASSNPGGVYKVWVSQDSSFPKSQSKTTAFKIKTPTVNEDSTTTTLSINKFYDQNTDGDRDLDSEPYLSGWKVKINRIEYNETKTFIGDFITPVNRLSLSPGTYEVTEITQPWRDKPYWVNTTPETVRINLAQGDSETVEFGSVYLSSDNSQGISYWGNSLGAEVFNDLENPLGELRALNLLRPDGTPFDPLYYNNINDQADSFRPWLLSTNSNLRYRLSAQLSVLELNTLAEFVDLESCLYIGDHQVFVGGDDVVSANGFVTVDNLIEAANQALAIQDFTDSEPSYQELLKTILEKANDDGHLMYVHPTPPNGPYFN